MDMYSQLQAPATFIRNEPQYPLKMKAGWPQSQPGQLWRKEKYLDSAGIRTSDGLPTATRYTDYDISALDIQESTVIQSNKSKCNSPVLQYR